MDEPRPLKELRAERGIGKVRLSKAAGLSTEIVQATENGREPTVKTIRRISAALGVEPTECREFCDALSVEPRPDALDLDISEVYELYQDDEPLRRFANARYGVWTKERESKQAS